MAMQDPRVDLRRLERTLRNGIYVAVLIALAYPWYANWVDRVVLARDLAAATRAFEAAVPAATTPRPTRRDAAPTMSDPISQFGADVAHHATRALRDGVDQPVQRNDAQSRMRRLAAVEVAGAMDVAPATLIVELNGAALEEARETICAQAAAVLRRPLAAGESLRVQRYRGNDPARELGMITCTP